jgi:hypothetical protein
MKSSFKIAFSEGSGKSLEVRELLPYELAILKALIGVLPPGILIDQLVKRARVTNKMLDIQRSVSPLRKLTGMGLVQAEKRHVSVCADKPGLALRHFWHYSSLVSTVISL